MIFSSLVETKRETNKNGIVWNNKKASSQITDQFKRVHLQMYVFDCEKVRVCLKKAEKRNKKWKWVKIFKPLIERTFELFSFWKICRDTKIENFYSQTRIWLNEQKLECCLVRKAFTVSSMLFRFMLIVFCICCIDGPCVQSVRQVNHYRRTCI